MIVKIWLAGNFPQLKYPEREKAVMRKMQKRGHEYHRLVSFFFPDCVENMLSIKKEETKK